MPTVSYLLNTFCIWHEKSVLFCVGVLKICILVVPRICILEFLLHSIQVFFAFICEKLNQNGIYVLMGVILIVLSIMISTVLIDNKTKQIFAFGIPWVNHRTWMLMPCRQEMWNVTVCCKVIISSKYSHVSWWWWELEQIVRLFIPQNTVNPLI